MSALRQKLLRDLFRLKGQVLTIAIVVACGIASYVTLGSAWRSLQGSREAYYERERFADVFVHLTRAPMRLAEELSDVPGVAIAYPRIVETVMLPMPDMAEPAVGQIVSIPTGDKPPLNGLYLRSGRMIEPGRSDEVLLLEAFANAHGLTAGDHIPAVISGRLRDLSIVGIALSPEYVMAVAPGDMLLSDKRFAVLWMDREAVAPAFEMEGAFNDVSFRLQPGASKRGVIEAIDRVVSGYGGLGAYGRERQISDLTLTGELAQLESFATVMPIIFLGVAAFLLNVVLSRLVQLQRGEIAVLKAVGYTDLEVGRHYLEMVSIVVVIGAALGVSAGAWLGAGLTSLYTQYFRFPTLTYELGADLVATSIAVSLAAAVVGGLATVWTVAQLPPAEAMRPPSPPVYKRSIVERIGLYRFLGASGRMVAREVTRRPMRTIVSSVGIAFAIAILVVGRFTFDAIEVFMDMQFQIAQREDLQVTFAEPLPERALRSLSHLPGVTYVEGLRVVPVRFRKGQYFRQTALIAHPDGGELRRVLDRQSAPVEMPEQGVVLDRMLAKILHVDVGDEVTIEVLEGDRRSLTVAVSALEEGMIGLGADMRLSVLSTLLDEETRVSAALMTIEEGSFEALTTQLKAMPMVIGVSRRQAAIDQFRSQSGETTTTMTLIMTLFASAIAIGVVYNNARVSLSSRGRELASLRVLGFSRAEVSTFLLSELSIQVLLGIPPGLLLGGAMSRAVATNVDPETYRLPVVISDKSYAFAIIVVLVSAIVSALIVRRRIDRLDLVAVLKTRE